MLVVVKVLRRIFFSGDVHVSLYIYIYIFFLFYTLKSTIKGLTVISPFLEHLFFPMNLMTSKSDSMPD